MKTLILALSISIATFPLLAEGNQKKETAEEVKYKDGVYQGSSKGYEDQIKVAVKIKDGKIYKIKILKQKESAARSSFKVIPERIIKEQKARVDAVSGATISSNAIMKAVENALSKAKLKK